MRHPSEVSTTSKREGECVYVDGDNNEKGDDDDDDDDDRHYHDNDDDDDDDGMPCEWIYCCSYNDDDTVRMDDLVTTSKTTGRD